MSQRTAEMELRKSLIETYDGDHLNRPESVKRTSKFDNRSESINSRPSSYHNRPSEMRGSVYRLRDSVGYRLSRQSVMPTLPLGMFLIGNNTGGASDRLNHVIAEEGESVRTSNTNRKSVMCSKIEEDNENGSGYVEHLLTLSMLESHVNTSINAQDPINSNGLTSSAASFKLQELGRNTLTPPARVPLWLLFLMQFLNIFMILLSMAGILSIIAYLIDPSTISSLLLGVILLVVVITSCYQTFSQEAKSDELMEKFRAMVPAAAMVRRDGCLISVSAEELVVGDIIRLNSGDKIPADCVVIYNSSMKVDQSMITGESEPVDSTTVAAEKNPLEARNLIFNGSLVVDGSCLAVVVRTGDDTLIGGMVELTGDADKGASTLKVDIQKFVFLLLKFAILQAVTVFVVSVIRGIPPLTAFVNGFIIIMVSNIPQGLPSTITASLFIIAERMNKQNVFVKKLDVVETLGSCSLICTDKTGTLTQNKMFVANIWTGLTAFTGTKALEKYAAEQSTEDGNYSGIMLPLRTLIDVATLNSRIVLKTSDSGDMEPSGDATELGLYSYFSQVLRKCLNTSIEEYRAEHPKVHEIPFNSANKWQMSIHHMPQQNGSGEEVLFLKGAPDVMLSKCSHYMNAEGSLVMIDEEFMSLYTTAYEQYGGQGQRVLGFAMKLQSTKVAEEVEKDSKFKEKLKSRLVGKSGLAVRDLCFIALVTLIDPPRVEVPQAIKDCNLAGVQVVMVTGDHPLTAAAIAKDIGIITLPTREELARSRGVPVADITMREAQAVVINGNQMDQISDEEWSELVTKKEIVFARTSPQQKLIIVNKFTAAGHVVAMTGDGVNDSPALKQAAIGIAMGMNGSDVAREAADIVLLDDNFASIVIGIREGRLLFANLKKSIAYNLSHLLPEVVPVFLWAFGGWPLGLNGVLVLCIDLITEIIPATSVAYEGPEFGIMSVPPRNPKKDFLFSTQLLSYAYLQIGIIESLIAIFVYFAVFKLNDLSASEIIDTNNEFFVYPTDGEYVSDEGEVFSEGDQQDVLFTVQGSWFLTIVFCQISHIFNIRTVEASIKDINNVSNRVTLFGVVFNVSFALFIVYVPVINTIVQAASPPIGVVLIATLAGFVFITFWAEFRKYYLRKGFYTDFLKL